jgi:hypothetical protein
MGQACTVTYKCLSSSFTHTIFPVGMADPEGLDCIKFVVTSFLLDVSVLGLGLMLGLPLVNQTWWSDTQQNQLLRNFTKWF